MCNYNDIDDLREEIKDYYGTAAIVMGRGNMFGCPGSMAELVDVDNMSDEDIIAKAEELGIR